LRAQSTRSKAAHIILAVFDKAGDSDEEHRAQAAVLKVEDFDTGRYAAGMCSVSSYLADHHYLIHRRNNSFSTITSPASANKSASTVI
jgi:hypothetical protein